MWLNELFTIGIMGILDASYGAAAEHHLVLGQRAGFIGEDVLHLAQIFGDIQSPTLQMWVCLLIVQVHVLMDKIHLADLHDLDRDEERDGDQNLQGTETPSEPAG